MNVILRQNKFSVQLDIHHWSKITLNSVKPTLKTKLLNELQFQTSEYNCNNLSTQSELKLNTTSINYTSTDIDFSHILMILRIIIIVMISDIG